ncbi:glycosyltransferase [Candidatus Paracaedibacter symbiosus]|uniref:glycosyltransferase n=1 Tax=Candidatus Paracaedibacter symbiosus TaxID=244582 RepID=UPI000509A820|nr:glycosyltransferase [Candidatus Paracaedibacter symbiosus]
MNMLKACQLKEHHNNEETGRNYHCMIFGFPSYGHTNPLLLLSAELVKSGYEVSFYNTDMFKKEIENTGAAFIDYKSPAAVLASQPMDCKTLDLEGLYEELNHIYDEVWTNLPRFTEHLDIIIYDQFAIWGKRYAEKNNITSLCSNTYLLTTPHYWRSNFKIEKLKENEQLLEEFINCLSGNSANGIIVYTPQEMQIVQPSADAKNIFFLGNRFASQYPPSTAKFGKKALIYISLGTVFNCDIELLKSLIDYFGNTKYNLIISSGNNLKIYEELSKLKLKPNIQVHKFIDQLKVLQEASLFITHGGGNSLYESLYFTVPMILFPQMEEQHINAQKMAELNVGYYFQKDGFSKDRMDEAMNNITQNWDIYKESTMLLREAIIRSSNAQKVVDQVNKLLSKNQRPPAKAVAM